MIRTVLVSLFVILLFAAVMAVYWVHPGTAGSAVADYYIHNFQSDTGAGNAVAAIYLNYRMYDTLFEALILLVSIIAMLHFFKAGGSA